MTRRSFFAKLAAAAVCLLPVKWRRGNAPTLALRSGEPDFGRFENGKLVIPLREGRTLRVPTGYRRMHDRMPK